MGSGHSECCGVKKSGDCGAISGAFSGASAPSEDRSKDSKARVVHEEEANPARSLEVETPQSTESPRRLDRRGNPILPRELTPGGVTHHVTFADEEGQPVEEVVEVLKRQASATDRLANGFKAIQSSFGCGKIMSRESRDSRA
mmetsp:Transcript_56713/g.115565  ORF Transcript_56713/g.115565 Transcript_56713/m.115565 type:complete len:143 (+) Transcript_56713:1-429(+)